MTSVVLARRVEGAADGSNGATEVSPEDETWPDVPPAESRSLKHWIVATIALAATCVAAVITLIIVRSSVETDSLESTEDVDEGRSVEDSETEDVDSTDSASSTDRPTTAPISRSEAELPTTVAPTLFEVSPSAITVEVSSRLPPSGDGSTYAASNLLDNNLDTAWNHCGSAPECGVSDADPGRNGIGELLVIRLPRTMDVVGLRVANGYQKTEPRDVWPENNRIALLDVYGTLGERQQVPLADSRDYQDAMFDPVATDTLTIEVREVYVGGEYRDLAVSEIRVLVRE